jgi:hypothetical protein
MDDKEVDLIPDLSGQSQEGHGSTRPNNSQKALRTDRDAANLGEQYFRPGEELIVCGAGHR